MSLPSTVQTLVDLSRSQRSKSEYNEAIQLLSSALKSCEPTGSCNSEQLGVLYNERGFTKYLNVDFDDAIEDYSVALKFDKKPVYYYNRGLIQYRLGRWIEAYKDTKKALELDPNFIEAKLCQQQAITDGNIDIATLNNL